MSSMVNHHESLFEEQDLMMFSSHLGIFPNFASLPHLPLKTLAPPPPPLSDLSKLQNDDFAPGSSQPHIFSLQPSPSNYWAWGELSDCMGVIKRDDRLGVSTMRMKMKMKKTRRRVREPRFCFKTMSDVDVLDDGYKWRKYGQKVVKNTQHPRSYYRCTQDNCRVKKRVERLADDPRMVITTYEGRHIHEPSNEDDESQASTQLNNFFW